MKRLLLLAGLVALTLAKPDSYKEKEDFQYSRSSTDEGAKSGYYGAQRGNMGGNYEKAHNMDGLAQNQMSGLVSQVHGELGEGANTKTGNVFGAGSTRGVYGQGNYDLSNLSGRNFKEGASYGSSGQQSASLSNQRAGAYSSSYDSQNALDSSRSLSSADSSRSSSSANSQSYGSSSGYNSHFRSQSGHSGQNEFERSRNHQNLDDSYGSENRARVHYSPMRVILRPATKIDIPFTAHTIEESDRSDAFDENKINRETERVNSNRGSSTGKSKQYESSFNYHKEWEKHDSSPSVIPLSRPTESSSHESVNDDYLRQHSRSQASGSRYGSLDSRYNSQDSRYNSQNSRYNSQDSRYNNQDSRYSSASRQDYGAKGYGSSQSRDEYGTDQHNAYQSYGTKSAHDRSNAYRDHEESINNLKTSDDKDKSPKKYESSFSYHKSWERRGDPYVILPKSDGTYDTLGSQRLTDASASQGHDYSSHQYGSQQYRQSQQKYSNSQDC